MKKWKPFIAALVLILFVSSNFAYASSIFETKSDNKQMMDEIKEKRDIVKQHRKTNAKLEKQVEKKSKEVEKMLVSIGKSNLAGQQEFETKFHKRLDVIANELIEIGSFETSMWSDLKTANRLIKAKKYEAGLKSLDKAINDLEKKHKMLVEFDKSLDELIIFLKSVQHK